jgi:HAD superfamily hydrolase (TIGR01509 family)
MPADIYQAWLNRDLKPHLHREAYLHVLQVSGLPDRHAEDLYQRVIDPASWTPYPDTARVLDGLQARGVRTAVVSNIAWDVLRAFDSLGCGPDEFVLSFEVGVVKPDPRIFRTALQRLGIPAEATLMIGDSEETDGAARAVGCSFAAVNPLPTTKRLTGLIDALHSAGLDMRDRNGA